MPAPIRVVLLAAALAGVVLPARAVDAHERVGPEGKPLLDADGCREREGRGRRMLMQVGKACPVRWHIDATTTVTSRGFQDGGLTCS